MAKKETALEKKLLEWFSTQRTTKIDIVGDFAGGELFAIHGESLVRYCLEKSQVDFDGGFQLLHAVYAVESFLHELQKRGCNFDLIFFRDTEDVSAPPETRDAVAYKYHVARAVLIRHLSRSDIRSEIHEFDSVESQECQEYLSSHVIHFILIHSGAEGGDESLIPLRYLMWKFVSSGRHVAVINDIALHASKAFVHLLSGSGILTGYAVLQQYRPPMHVSSAFGKDEIKVVPSLSTDSSAESLREWTAVAFCRGLLRQRPAKKLGEDNMRQVFALLLHMAILRLYSIKERRCNVKNLSPEDELFLQKFSGASLTFLENGGVDEERLSWDLFDLVDGRIFSFVMQSLETKRLIPEEIFEVAHGLWQDAIQEDATYAKGDFNIASHSPPLPKQQSSYASNPVLGILPFSHPAFDQFLRNVKVNEVEEITDFSVNAVFEDLRHWHNTKLVVSTKPPPKLGFWAMRYKQNLMTEVLRYAESLQGSRGKVFERETVIVQSRHSRRLACSGVEPEGISDQKKEPKKGKKKGGRASAQEAALEVQNRKALAKRGDVARFWAGQCAEFQANSTLIDQYLKAQDFLFTRSRSDRKYLEPEVQLYMCHILGKIWVATRKNVDENSPQGIYLLSMMWNMMQSIAKSEASTPNIAKGLLAMTTSIGMPLLNISAGEPSRPLPFYLEIESLKATVSAITDHRFLQIEHGGPYMERRFDSKPDPRVPFEPDAWQRKVLDSVDANDSLLVVAPTSAGKTFISFYAMKKVLEESDDGVLVYVAPTKALVNQIAAEIEARFSKSYNGKPGKSVWAIHTRDYRINNPSQCQILVTVPHILQIMLLSPVNASHANGWSRRVKRIIFDEVHCIGQADDGVVWEQLLLMAPCPIIALSATVGNPQEFRHWLEVSQAQKGFKITMVVHGVRYSDLRKFIYHPSRDDDVFKELSKSPQLPVPGLDEGGLPSRDFEFVHPILALNNRHRETLDDVSLEARDCLALWKSMKDCLPSHLQSEVESLNPQLILPKIISKSDIVEWERGLKKVLRKGMGSSESVLRTLQANLGSASQVAQMATSDIEERKEKKQVKSLFSLVCNLHSQNALPAIVFNYDRLECEGAVQYIFNRLESSELEWKMSDPGWLRKLSNYEQWKKNRSGARTTKPPARGKADKTGDGKMSKLEMVRDTANVEISAWESFDPNAPLSQFNFSDPTKMAKTEFNEMINKLHHDKVSPILIKALERGLGVHHAGMNRRYRQIVEVMFRNGYLRIVVATGTLALGINMPCKTVVFSSDSVYLTAQNYRQASGRAGRRGFDLLGNVVFNDIPRNRVHEIMSSRLPDLKGQFPISTTLILRLFSLLHGTENSEFAMDAVRALTSQTRLYLGGPDAEMSIKHHLRFSIEYLRRQSLVSANGTPLNFAGLVGHLYFTENAVFAFHSLLRGGYFHRLCADIGKSSERILLEIMLVLSHLFGRIPIQRTRKLEKKTHRASSIVFLPRLPKAAETMLVQHNQETLSIFKKYVSSYIGQFLADKPDRTMPFTRTDVGPYASADSEFLGCTPTDVRSPFVALSGFGDEFETIQELCTTVRGGVFLEESAIPYIPIWPHDTNTEFNAYLLDFYKHGSMEDLKRSNQIKGGDVWFLLKDFSLILKTIVTSLRSLTGAGADPFDFESDDWEESEDGDVEMAAETQESVQTKPLGSATKPPERQPSVLESWEDDEDSAPSNEARSSQLDATMEQPCSAGNKGEGLMNVLKAFVMLEETFETKFRKVWA